MVNDWNNVKPVGCKPWLVLPAVYSDALSYGDQIAHFCAALNKLIQNNNTLPEYIQQMIQDYINGDVIGEVVQNIVSQFILNVKYPPENLTPAVGDGSADDTEAIQGCINYAKNHNGMAVYIPSGAYSVQSLTLPGDVSLFGFDRYTTKLVLRGGATTPMISSAGTGFSIVGLTLDGNAGVQVENINILSLISQDVLLRDLIVQNGYKLLVYNGTGGHLQINDVVFGSAVYDCVEISGGSIVQLDNCQFTALSQVSGQHVIDISSDDGVYDFVNSAVCPVCCVVSGNDNNIKFSSIGAITNFTDTGERNNILVYGQEMKWYLADDFNGTIENSVGINVNGAYSENISGMYKSVKNSGESEKVSGGSTKEYGSSQTETIATKKTVNAIDMVLNITNPLQYKIPIALNDYFKYIQFKDTNNDIYNVLVENNKTKFIGKTSVSVLEFGAVGDGITDDSEAFQAALDSGFDVYVPFNSGERYLINKTLNVSTNVQAIYSDFPHRTGENPSNNVGKIIAGADPLFNVTSGANIFCNLAFRNGLTEQTGTCLKFNDPDGNGNTDAQISGCGIWGFNTGIWYDGRGMLINDNIIVYCVNGISGRYTSTGETGNIYQKPTTGYRAIRVTNNRFHSCTIDFINESGVIRGGLFANNNSDIGLQFLVDRGGLNNSIIANNVCDFCTNSAIACLAECDGLIIIGNTLRGDEVSASYPTNMINFGAETQNIIIVGNTINGTDNDGVVFFNTTHDTVVSDNTIKNYAINTKSGGAIRFNSMDGVIVKNNNLQASAGATSAAIRETTSSNTTSAIHISGNTSNHPLYGNFYNISSPFILEGYRVDEAPTNGTWRIGDIMYKRNPTDFIGWVCTAAGTPGTWKTFGAVTQ